MKRSLFTLLTLIPCVVFAQGDLSSDKIVALQVEEARSSGATFESVQLFSPPSGDDPLGLTQQLAQVEDAIVFSFERTPEQLSALTSAQDVSIQIPNAEGDQPIILDLLPVDLFSSDFVTNVDVGGGVHYRGVIRGDQASLVSISIFDDEVIGFLHVDGQSKTIGKVKGSSDTHILYNEFDQGWVLEHECGNVDEDLSYDPHDVAGAASGRAPGDCIRQKFEIDESLTNQIGGLSQATNYATGVFNAQQTLYANDGINVVLSELKVWSNADPAPYTINQYNTLDSYQAQTGSFNGDVAYLGFYQGGWNGGVAAAIGGICQSNPDNSKAIGGHYGYYSSLPTYSNDVFIVCHEVGHLFGARHTHACVWNGNNTAIDGCSGQTEGSCSLPFGTPSSPTIMSYCSGVDFNEGFHPQVAQAIENYVASRSCTSPCSGPQPTCTDGIQNGDETGVDCGGSCAPCGCNGNNVTVSITLDNYPEETSWQITQGGSVVASGGTYASQPDGSTVQASVCLPDGCYNFTIVDSYGDGICCSYGIGSYTVSDEDGTLASGGDFSSTESTSFCVSSPSASCDDGIQNQGEEGVDCGGPCVACPSCNDGIQNQGETGVDCGGPCGECPCSGTELTVSITLDNYPEETTWSITQGGGTVASGGTYGNVADGSTINIDLCLPLGCYNFTINDSYGDGICCSYGLGSYVVSSSTGAVYASGGAFGSTESTFFCTSGAYPGGSEMVAENSQSMMDELAIFPNPTSDLLSALFTVDYESQLDLRILDMQGRLITDRQLESKIGANKVVFDTSIMEEGTYLLIVVSDGIHTTRPFVVQR